MVDTVKSRKLLFGTAGAPLSSISKSTESGIERVAELGFGCLEVQFVRGVKMNEGMARQVGDVAKKCAVRLTAHAPYFINLNAHEKEKTLREYTGKHLFNHIFSERRIGYLKTETEYYKEALRRAGAKPEETYSIGDTPLSDIRPAKLIGIGTIWLNRRNEPTPSDHEQVADFQATTLEEAVKHLENFRT